MYQSYTLQFWPNIKVQLSYIIKSFCLHSSSDFNIWFMRDWYLLIPFYDLTNISDIVPVKKVYCARDLHALQLQLTFTSSYTL